MNHLRVMSVVFSAYYMVHPRLFAIREVHVFFAPVWWLRICGSTFGNRTKNGAFSGSRRSLH